MSKEAGRGIEKYTTEKTWLCITSRELKKIQVTQM